MKQIAGVIRRTKFGAVAALFLFTAVAVALPARQASALGLLYRSLQVSSTAGGNVTPIGSGGEAALPGTGANGQKVSHTYVFQASTAGSIKGIGIEFCNDPFGYAGTCNVPDGFTAAAWTGGTATVSASNGGTSFAANDITYAAGATFNVSAASATTVEVNNVTGVTAGSSIATGQFIKVVFTADATHFFRNPDALYQNGLTAPNQSQTFYAHLTTYNDDTPMDNTTDVDEGTVTSSVANTVTVNTRVQETLKFSVGGSGGSADTTPGTANAPTAACTALDTNGALTMGDSNESLSAAGSSTALSFARIATNSSKGAKILYAGQTLKSTAGDQIAAIGGTAAATGVGTEQFGLAVLNTATQTNADYTDLAPTAQYNFGVSGGYAFDTTSNTVPVVLASSPDVIACDTLPIQYLANISNETPAGLYSTKVSYIAVPSY